MLRHPIRSLVAAWLVLRAALRVWWLEPRRDLAALVTELRNARRLDTDVDRVLVAGIVERLLPFLPPRGAGRCVKRSLMLLDVWTRAGLTPRIHLGFSGAGSEREGHVWVSVGGDARPDGFTETWSA